MINGLRPCFLCFFFFNDTATTEIYTLSLHDALPIPSGDNGADYSPAAVGPEMPTSLPGNKANRVEQAKAYHARAVAVVDKTRGLLTLECEDAWFRLVEASRRKQHLLTARDRARKYADAIRDDFREVGANGADKKQRESLNTVLDAGVLAAQTRVEYNQALYQYDLELAALERITG